MTATEHPGLSPAAEALNALFRQPLHPGWAEALAGEYEHFRHIIAQLQRCHAEGEHVLPAPDMILRAFRQPFDEVKVLILGQDPYPTPGHPIGLAFAVDSQVRPLPKSLLNIYRELADDVGVAPAAHGDLSSWCDQGVLLLNTVLSVRARAPKSHHHLGWQQVTEAAIRALAARGTPLVAILWGADAGSYEPLLRNEGVDSIIRSPHPSPLAAYRGFFGSRPFSRTNTLLAAQGAAIIDWTVR